MPNSGDVRTKAVVFLFLSGNHTRIINVRGSRFFECTANIGVENVGRGTHKPLGLRDCQRWHGTAFYRRTGRHDPHHSERSAASRPFPQYHQPRGVGEEGLLGLAFHPLYKTNGRSFANYTRRVNGQLQTVIAEYHVSSTDPNKADPRRKKILVIDQPFDNHNGGQLAFVPDKFLYIALGDGGSVGDPLGNGQKLGTLLGKLLRINVDSGTPYVILPDNPFVGNPSARGEIWAYGLRNPWRFSFDRGGTHRLFAGDVGQDNYEEVDIIRRGRNYGWNIMEGFHCYPRPLQTAT